MSGKISNNKNRHLKIFISVLVSSVMVLSLCSCGSNNTEPKKSEVKISQPSEVKPESSQPVVAEESEAEADPENFVVLSKLDELPDEIKNNSKLYCELLEGMLKLYYYGIVSGRIDEETVKFRYAEDILPEKNAGPQERKENAGYCKVGGAMEFFAYDCKNYLKYHEIYNGCLPYFCYTKEANIYLSSEVRADDLGKLNGFDQTLNFIFKYANINDVERDAIKFAAKETDRAVKEYYAGIKNGTINKNTFKPKFTKDALPEANADAEECYEAASHATVAGALEYSSLYTALSPFADKLVFSKTKNTITYNDLNETDVISIRSANAEISSFLK